MFNLPLLAFSLLFCSSLSLLGCGPAARVQGWFIGQQLKGGAAPVLTALDVAAQIQQKTAALAPTPAAAPPELIEHENELRRLQRTYQLENEMRKQDLMRERLSHRGQTGLRPINLSALQAANRQLLDQYDARHDLVP